MDLSLTVEEAAFRDECRNWLQGNLPWDYGTGLPPLFADLAEEVAFLRDWQRRLAGAAHTHDLISSSPLDEVVNQLGR